MIFSTVREASDCTHLPSSHTSPTPQNDPPSAVQFPRSEVVSESSKSFRPNVGDVDGLVLGNVDGKAVGIREGNSEGSVVGIMIGISVADSVAYNCKVKETALAYMCLMYSEQDFYLCRIV